MMEGSPSVAIVHDFLVDKGGAERVVLSMIKAFPAATVTTLLYAPSATFEAFSTTAISTSWLNGVPGAAAHHRATIPLLPLVAGKLKIDADIVVCSTSGWAHGVATRGMKVAYCYSPARWLYQEDRYFGEGRSITRSAMRLASPALRRWDRNAMATVDHIVTSSEAVRSRIQETYDRLATILPPPATIDVAGPQKPVTGVDPGFYLCVSRLLRYKNVAAVAAAFSGRQDRLLIAGDGPELSTLRRSSPRNVSFLGKVTEDQLRWLYQNAKALVAASHEDFGLTPLEAASFGKPSIVLHDGGFVDTVIGDLTGVFFEQPTSRAITSAIDRACELDFDPARLRAHAARYSEDGFVNELRELVADLYQRREARRPESLSKERYVAAVNE